MVKDIPELATGDPGVHSDHDRAKRTNCEISNDQLRPIVHYDCDVVMRTDTQCKQALSEGPDLVPQLRIGESTISADQCLSVRKAIDYFIKQIRNGSAFRQ